MSSCQSEQKVKLFFFQWIRIKLTSCPTFLFNFSLRFNPTPTFLGVIFDHTVFFSKHVSLLKAKFFPRLKVLCCIFAFSWGLSKESLFHFCIKLFFGPLSVVLYLDGFLSLMLPNLPNWNAFTERLVALCPAASRPILFHFSSLRRFVLPYKSL